MTNEEKQYKAEKLYKHYQLTKKKRGDALGDLGWKIENYMYALYNFLQEQGNEYFNENDLVDLAAFDPEHLRAYDCMLSIDSDFFNILKVEGPRDVAQRIIDTMETQHIAREYLKRFSLGI